MQNKANKPNTDTDKEAENSTSVLKKMSLMDSVNEERDRIGETEFIKLRPHIPELKIKTIDKNG